MWYFLEDFRVRWEPWGRNLRAGFGRGDAGSADLLLKELSAVAVPVHRANRQEIPVMQKHRVMRR